MKHARRFRFELLVLNGLVTFLLFFPCLLAGQDLTVEARKDRIGEILKDLHAWGVTAEARFGCDIGPNPYAGNERYLLVLELIGHYDELGNKRQVNLWRRHMARFYELGLRDCGVLSPEDAGPGSQSLVLAHKLYKLSGDRDGVERVTAKVRGSAVAANSKTPPTTYRGMPDE